jgi:fructose-bisphosphate aldolase class II
MKPAREAMKKVVAQRMTQFGQAGHGSDYKAIPLSENEEVLRSHGRSRITSSSMKEATILI